MSESIINTFSTYELTDKEALQSAVFTNLQLQNLQNQLANAADEKIRLEVDTNNINAFIQQEASLKGQIDILSFLINGSAEAADQLNNPNAFDDQL